MSENLTGSYRVRVFGAALRGAQKTWPRAKDRMIVRRHALKLRYWPAKNPTDDSGEILDLDWSWIKALKGTNIGELRIHDTIGGQDNIRIVFYVPETKPSDGEMPVLWVLEAFQKKRDDFTKPQLKVFEFRRSLIVARFTGM